MGAIPNSLALRRSPLLQNDADRNSASLPGNDNDLCDVSSRVLFPARQDDHRAGLKFSEMRHVISMATLPRLHRNRVTQPPMIPAGYRAVTQPIRPYAAPSNPPKQAPDGGHLVIEGIRDAAAARFQAYEAQLTQMERAFELESKRSDQQSNRNVARCSDAVGSLASEMSQLTRHVRSISQKLALVRQRQQEVATIGVTRSTAPLRSALHNFEQEYGRASADIDALFKGHTADAATISDQVNSLKGVSKSVAEFEGLVEKLKEAAKQNSLNLFTCREELTAIVHEERTLLMEQLTSRIRSVTSKAQQLQSRVLDAMTISQDVISETEASQADIRNSYSETMGRIRAQFKAQITDVKRKLNELTDFRYSQIVAVRERIAGANDSLRESGQRRMKRAISDAEGGSKRSAISEEIEALDRICSQVEELIDNVKPQKVRVKKPKPGVRCFYHVEEDGKVKLIWVDENGIIPR
jgi:predicted  nucleic acid-binding Zn-ribbon protein